MVRAFSDPFLFVCTDQSATRPGPLVRLDIGALTVFRSQDAEFHQFTAACMNLVAACIVEDQAEKDRKLFLFKVKSGLDQLRGETDLRPGKKIAF